MNEKQKFSACSQQKSSFTKHYKSIKPSDKGELQPKKKKKRRKGEEEDFKPLMEEKTKEYLSQS